MVNLVTYQLPVKGSLTAIFSASNTMPLLQGMLSVNVANPQSFRFVREHPDWIDKPFQAVAATTSKVVDRTPAEKVGLSSPRHDTSDPTV